MMVANITKARAVRAQHTAYDREAFAEAISVLGTVRSAASFLGMSERTGERHMREIRRELGAQAR